MRATALLVVICKLHLLLCAVCRQPLPVGQCCPLCNATDWGSIQWSNSLASFQQRTPVSLGNDVTQLRNPLGLSSTSSSSLTLRDVVMTANFSSVCQEDDGAVCPHPVRWQLGSWGACSTTCDGGVAYRTAACMDSTTGEWYHCTQ